VALASAWLAVTLDAPAEEVQALVDGGDQRLGGRQAQAHRRQDRRDRIARLLGVLAVAGYQDQKVIRLCRVPGYADLVGGRPGQSGVLLLDVGIILRGRW
jgi:hypothetical protein